MIFEFALNTIPSRSEKLLHALVRRERERVEQIEHKLRLNIYVKEI